MINYTIRINITTRIPLMYNGYILEGCTDERCKTVTLEHTLNKIVGSNVVIGKKLLSNYTKNIAKQLGLPNAEQYTSHSLKRSGITFMANAGMNVSEIKKHTGHKSDKVVEGYVFNSMAQKRKASEALMVGNINEVNNYSSSISQINSNIEQTSNAMNSTNTRISYNFGGPIV